MLVTTPYKIELPRAAMEDADDSEWSAVPLPVDSSDEDDEDTELPTSSGDAGDKMEQLLRDIATGASRPPTLFDAEHWRAFGAQDGLHVDCVATAQKINSDHSAAYRKSLDERGYFQCRAEDDSELHERLTRGLRRLKAAGYAPAFIYVFDEAWIVLERWWRTLAAVLAAMEDSEDERRRLVESSVLEPSFGAHVLSRPAVGSNGAASNNDEADATEIKRHTHIGGAFSKPHRDHSSSDCFDSATGKPTLLSLWVPLTEVVKDNGCMHIVQKEYDPLLHQPEHPLHLSPHKSLDWGGVVALAPLTAGSALAWHGSSIHWGARCSAYSTAEPRASLTGAVRLAAARHTLLQSQQESALPELTLDKLPLPLEERLRYVAGSILLYRWWYGLNSGVLPPEQEVAVS